MDDTFTWGSQTIAERPVFNSWEVGAADFTLRNSKYPVIVYSTYSPHILRSVTWKNGRKIDEPILYFANEVVGLQMTAAGEKVAMILCLKLAQNHFQLRYSALGSSGWSEPELVYTGSTGIIFDFKLAPDGSPFMVLDHRLNIGSPSQDEIRFYERRASGWEFQTIRPLTQYPVQNLKFAVTHDGEPHVAWTEGQSGTGSAPAKVYHATRNAGAWTRVPLFEGTLTALSNGPGGEPFLFAKLYEGPSNCYLYQDGTWGPPQTLPGWYASWTQSVATAPDGTVYAPALDELQIRRDGIWSNHTIPVFQKVAVDETGVPHFFTMTEGLIRYHTRIPALWQDQQVTPADESHTDLTDLHFTASNALRLFALDYDNGGSVVMTPSPAGWNRVPIPSPPNIGLSYQEGPDGSLHVLAGGFDYYLGSLSSLERYYPGIPLNLLNNSRNPSMTVDSGNVPHLTFTAYDSHEGQNKAYHAERKNGVWTYEIVAAIGTDEHSAIATGKNGGLYILSAGGLYKKDGISWAKEWTIPSNNGVALVVGDDEMVHGFFQTWNRIIVFSGKDGVYQQEVLDHVSGIIPRPQMTLAAGRPVVLHVTVIDHNEGIYSLRVAEKVENYWRQETLTPFTPNQEYRGNIRIAADRSGKIHVAADRSYWIGNYGHSYIEFHQREAAASLDLAQAPVLRLSPTGRREFRIGVPETPSPLAFQSSGDLQTWSEVFDFSQPPQPANGSANLEFRGDGFRQDLIYRPAANQKSLFGRLAEAE